MSYFPFILTTDCKAVMRHIYMYKLLSLGCVCVCTLTHTQTHTHSHSHTHTYIHTYIRESNLYTYLGENCKYCLKIISFLQIIITMLTKHYSITLLLPYF
jgi:hypothetical protein